MSRKPRRKTGDYEVGYGKPPKHTQFKPGQSGNPRGRPKGSQNLATLVEEALAELVTVKEGGRQARISKGKAAATQLVNKAAAADLRAIRILLALQRQTAIGSDADASSSPADGGPCPHCGTSDDYSYLDKLTTEELATVYEAVALMEGKMERPPPLVPPTGPKRRREEDE
jgi:hypothetical protein